MLPVTINNQSFDYTYFVVDGIYPQYSRIVKPSWSPSQRKKDVLLEPERE
jgi:Plant transposon protein